MHAMFECSADGMFLIDPQGRCVDVNPAGCRMFGYTPDEILGSDVGPLLFPEGCRSVFAGGSASWMRRAFVREHRMRRKDGSDIWVEMTVTPLTIGGEPFAFSVKRDITERVRAERALRESELKFRSIVEHSHDGIVLIDEQGTIIEWNQGLAGITGVRQSEALGQPIWDVQYRIALDERKTPGARERVRARVARFFQDGQASWMYQPVEQEIQRPDGMRRIIQAMTFPIETSKGCMAGGICRDITEQVRAVEALRKSEEKHRNLVENISDVIYALDEQGVITYVSPVVESSTGYSPAELVGRPFANLIHPEDLARAGESFPKALSGHMEVNEYRVLTKRGDARWARVSSRQVRVEDRVAGVQGVLADITDRVLAAQAMSESRDTIRALYQRLANAREQERRRIAKDVHDEIVQPLTVVLYQADLLDIEPEKVNALSTALAQVSDRCRMIMRNLYPPELDRPLAKAVQALPTGDIPLLVRTQADSDAEASLSPDLKLGVYRVIQEAVNNAARHAGASEIVVDLELDQQRLRFQVTDDGRGFDPTTVEKLGHSASRPGGLGLGLMRERIDALGGTLNIDSQPGNGTRVSATIALPAQCPKRQLDMATA